MNKYLKGVIFLTIFTAIMFVCTTQKVDAFSGFSMNLGFSSQSMYGNFGNPMPFNCFNAGYPCNGYFGNQMFNQFPQNSFYDYGNYGYGMGYMYNTMSSPMYYNSTQFLNTYPMRNYGGYVNNNMYSTYNNSYSVWNGF